MAQASAPLYGRFSFPTLHEFIERLHLVSNQCLSGSVFTSYLTTFRKQSFYGLDYDELAETFAQHESTIKTITTSASDEKGSSVNLNTRFPSEGGTGEVQYIILARNRYEGNIIRSILQGTWEPKSEEDKDKDSQLLKLVETVAEYKEIEEEIEKEEISNRPKPPIQEPERNPQSPLTTIRDSFHFEESMSPDVLIELLDQISRDYLQEIPFQIRMITTDGELYSNIGYSGLERILDKRRNLILKVYADATSHTGESVKLTLGYGPNSRKHNAELEVIARQSREIRSLVRDRLEDSVDFLMPSASMVHEMFWFDQGRFNIDRVIRLVQQLSQSYFEQEIPTAFLSTTEGKTYPALTLKQVYKVYQQYEGRIGFLMFGINQSLTGQTFSLMFQFRTPEHDPFGSLSMMWGSEDIHQLVRTKIWEVLSLRRYHTQSPSSPSPKTEDTQKISVQPLFSGRGFSVQPRSSLVVMPLEAYWSDSMWMHLQQTLRAVGWESGRAGALYSQNILEDTWQAINQVELVIGDVTYKHPDVFYKIGIAHTLGKRVILITQHARDIPPDFMQYSHIVYDNNIHGLQRLSERLADLLRIHQ